MKIFSNSLRDISSNIAPGRSLLWVGARLRIVIIISNELCRNWIIMNLVTDAERYMILNYAPDENMKKLLQS